MKSLDTIRWGFIGCGEATEKKSGPAFSLFSGSRVVAVMSRREEKAKSYARRHGIERYYTDVASLVSDSDVNAVYIATPPSSHATFAIMALKAGKPAYIEKPMAASYEECLRINRIVQLTGTPCFVAYYRRSLPYFLRVKELLDSGSIGKLLSVQVCLNVPPRELDYNMKDLPWRLQSDIAGGGGYFYDLAPHQIDILQFVIGSYIIEAEGFCSNRGGLYSVPDTINACFKFSNGVTGSASWCFVSHESARSDRIELVGELGTIAFSVYDYDPIHIDNVDGHRDIVVPNPSYVQLPLIERVIGHLQGHTICDCNNVSATSVNWVMDKILGKFKL